MARHPSSLNTTAGWPLAALAAALLLSGAACSTSGSQAGLPDGAGIRIEAEAFTRVQGSGVRVRPHDEAAASGRGVLVGFATADAVSWTLPTCAGSRALWLRYAARRPVRLRWRVGEDWNDAELPGTGALEGEGAFAWERLGELSGSPAPTSLTLAGAGLRPDCFELLPPGQTPTDSQTTFVPLSEATRAALRAAPPRPVPGWLAAASETSLPAWIDDARVGLHTRLSVAWVGRPIFGQAEAAAASLGAPALVRHVKSMRGECYWPSRVGTVAGWVEKATQGGLDPVQAMAERAHDAGLAFVAYYRHQEDRPLAAAHPDWVCRDVHGRTIRTAGEPRLCYHSPFAEATWTRFVELAERGVDGIYLDEGHQPLGGCWCEWTRAAFERATGLPLPASDRLEDPLYRRFLAFTEDSLAQRLAGWRARLANEHPDCTLIVSTHRQPDPLGARPTLRLATVGGVVKTELALGAPTRLFDWLDAHPSAFRPSRAALLTLGWAESRDGGFGRPAHVWIHGLAGAGRWRAATAAILASGNLANLDHPERTLPDPATFGPSFELARSLAPALAGTRPARTILLHLPERARNALLPDEEAAWSACVEPLLRAWQGLSERHLPAAILSDDLFAAGLPAETALLFLPAPASLEPAQREALRAYESAGGRVFRGDAEALLQAALELPLPAHVEAPRRALVTWLRAPDGATVLALANAPSWVLEPKAGPPAPLTDVRLVPSPGVRSLRVWPGPLALEATAGTSAVPLPSFQDALVVRIETED